MSVRKNINDNNRRIKKLKLSMILGYTVIIILITSFISAIAFSNQLCYDIIMKDHTTRRQITGGCSLLCSRI